MRSSSSSAWLLLATVLLVLTFFLSPSNAANIEFNTAASDEYMRELSNRKDVGGLAGWAAMGSGMRRSALRGYPTEFIASVASGNFSMSGTEALTPLLTYLTPIMVMLGFCIVFAVAICFVCPCFYCCRSCGNCGGSQPKIEGYTPKERICAIVTMAIGLTMISIGFIIGLVSNGVLSQGISDLQFSVQETVGDVLELPGLVTDAVGQLLGDAETAVDNVVDLIGDVPDGILGTSGTLGLVVFNITDSLRNLQITLDNLNQKARDLGTATDNLEQSVDEVNMEMNNVNIQIAGLNDWKPAPSGATDEYYRMNSTCVPILPVVNVTGVFPNFTSIIEGFSTPNLTDVANNIDDIFSTISDNVTDTLNSQLGGITGALDGVLNTTQSTVNDTLGSVMGSVVNIVQNAHDVIAQYSTEYVIPIDYKRYAIMAALFALSMLAVVFCLLGFFFKKSGIMTCSAVFCFFLIILYWIVCALHLIIAAPVGKICDIYYDKAITEVIPPGLINIGGSGSKMLITRDFSFSNLTQGAPVLSGHATFDEYVDTFYGAVDYCHQGGNLVDFFNLTTAIDVDGILDDYLDQMNLTAMIEGFDVEGVMGDVDLTGGFNFTQLTSYFDYLSGDFSVYVNLLANLALQPMQLAIDATFPLIDGLMDAANTTVCVEHNLTSPTDLDDAVAELQARLTAIRQDLDTLNTTTMAYAHSNISEVQTSLDAFSAATNETTDKIEDLLLVVDTLDSKIVAVVNQIKDKIVNHTLPDVIHEMHTMVNSIIGTARKVSDCQWVADDLLGTLGSVCVQTVGGLDTVWITCGFLALMLVGAIVGITLVAKRWIRADTMDQEYGEDYYQNNEYELPPMYSESHNEKA